MSVLRSFDSRFLRLSLVARFALVFIVAGTARPACASTSLRGFIHLANGQVAVALKTSPDAYKVSSSRPDILKSLATLHDGDYVITTGDLDAATHTLDVEAIESVGLQALLGIWRTQAWQVFEFRDFNRLNLYSSTQSPPSSLGLEKLREFSYVLAPDSKNGFSILLSDDKAVHVGSLVLTDSSVHIQLFDSNTGAVAQDISLSPLPLN